jgi:hypothetical protein
MTTLSKSPKGNYNLWLALISIAITLFILFSCSSPKPHDTAKAKVITEYYIQEFLVSPSTASFSQMEAKVIGDHKYRVTGCVDSQNSFGGVMREYFSVDVEFTPDGNNSEFSNLEL